MPTVIDAVTQTFLDQNAGLSRSGQAPLNSFSHQILRAIFIYCLPDRPQDDVPHIDANDVTPTSRRAMPLVLASVCQKWRQVALATPALWAEISLGTPSIVFDAGREVTYYDLTAQTQAVTDFACRRGTLGLSLGLGFGSRAVVMEQETPMNMEMQPSQQEQHEEVTPKDESGPATDSLYPDVYGDELTDAPPRHGHPNTSPHTSLVFGVFDLLNIVINRLESLTISMPSAASLEDALELFRDMVFPALRDLRIIGFTQRAILDVAHPAMLPSIRRLVLDGPSAIYIPPQVFTPLPSGISLQPHILDSLVLRDLPWYDADVLHYFISALQCDNILAAQALDLQFAPVIDNGQEFDSMAFFDGIQQVSKNHRKIFRKSATLPHVKSLKIYDGHFAGFNAAALPQLLVLPALQELSLVIERGRRLLWWPGLLDMLESAKPRLRKLEVIGTSMKPTEMQRCLNIVSKTLEDLTVDGYLFTRAVISKLMWLERFRFRALRSDKYFKRIGCGDYLCPRLSRLEIYGCCPAPESYLTKLIISRSSFAETATGMDRVDLRRVVTSKRCMTLDNILSHEYIIKLIDRGLLDVNTRSINRPGYMECYCIPNVAHPSWVTYVERKAAGR